MVQCRPTDRVNSWSGVLPAWYTIYNTRRLKLLNQFECGADNADAAALRLTPPTDPWCEPGRQRSRTTPSIRRTARHLVGSIAQWRQRDVGTMSETDNDALPTTPTLLWRRTDVVVFTGKWPAISCQWYPTGDVRTHNSRTDSRRILKLGGGVDHVTIIFNFSQRLKPNLPPGCLH